MTTLNPEFIKKRLSYLEKQYEELMIQRVSLWESLSEIQKKLLQLSINLISTEYEFLKNSSNQSSSSF